LSSEHFSVDGTRIEAWASVKSFRPKDGGGGSQWRVRFSWREAQQSHKSLIRALMECAAFFGKLS
jgi:hypothetical protein